MVRDDTQSSVECGRVRGGKFLDITYRDGARVLRIELELAGFFFGFDWVGALEDLATWSEPAGEAIPVAEQARILERIEAWGHGAHRRVKFFPLMSAQQNEEQWRRDGYTREVLPDGRVMERPPASFLARLRIFSRIFFHARPK